MIFTKPLSLTVVLVDFALVSSIKGAALMNKWTVWRVHNTVTDKNVFSYCPFLNFSFLLGMYQFFIH